MAAQTVRAFRTDRPQVSFLHGTAGKMPVRMFAHGVCADLPIKKVLQAPAPGTCAGYWHNAKAFNLTRTRDHEVLENSFGPDIADGQLPLFVPAYEFKNQDVPGVQWTGHQRNVMPG